VEEEWQQLEAVGASLEHYDEGKLNMMMKATEHFAMIKHLEICVSA